MPEPAQSPPSSPLAVPLLFDLIDRFCEHLRQSAGASPSAANTAQAYTNAMTIFKRFLQRSYSRKRGFKAPYPVMMLDSDILLAYYDWLTKTSPPKKTPSPTDPDAPPEAPHYAPSTIQHYLAAAKRFLSWGVAQGHLPHLDLGKATVRLKDGRGGAKRAYSHRKIDPNLAAIVLYYDDLPLPTDEEIAAASNNLAAWQVWRRRVAILRNRAIVHVLYDTGLRVSELTSLTRDEIDRALKETPLPEDVAIEVVGKGGRRRTVWITRDSLERIRDYLDARKDSSNILFIGSKKGTPITRQMVWKIVKEGAKAAGVGDFTGPHAFRHWLARQLFNDEEDPVPIEDVQALLGHASPTTTRIIYAPHTSKSRLHRALKRARKRPEETLSPPNSTDPEGPAL